MLADHWVIAQIIGQASSFVLILIALIHSMSIIHKWDPFSSSELQLYLERRTYLVSILTKYVLIFQVITLVLFLVTVNNHLPGLIKGAMCASGTLSVNQYGYPYLYLKIIAVFIYIIFLFINYLDQAEPTYPLTPGKFRLIPIIFVLISADLILLLLYFINIKPDIIATCCSISFSVSNRWDETVLAGGYILDWVLPVFYLIALLLFVFAIKKKYKIAFILSILFVPVALYLLKYHFVKFIYALPTHNCLFDIFWKEYYYIGYILYGSMFVLVTSLGLEVIFRFIQLKIQYKHLLLSKNLRIAATTALLIFIVLVTSYWWFWITFRL